MAATTPFALLAALKAMLAEFRQECEIGYEDSGRRFHEPATEGPRRGDRASDFYRALKLGIARLWGVMQMSVHEQRLELLDLAPFRKQLAARFADTDFIAIRGECGEVATPQLERLRARLVELTRTGEPKTIDAHAERIAFFAAIPEFPADNDLKGHATGGMRVAT